MVIQWVRVSFMGNMLTRTTCHVNYEGCDGRQDRIHLPAARADLRVGWCLGTVRRPAYDWRNRLPISGPPSSKPGPNAWAGS